MDHSEERKKGKSSYKAKRSFSKNKKRRTDSGEKSYSGGYRKDFKRERSFDRKKESREDFSQDKKTSRRKEDGESKSGNYRKDFKKERSFDRKKESREDYSNDKNTSRHKEGSEGRSENYRKDFQKERSFGRKKEGRGEFSKEKNFRDKNDRGEKRSYGKDFSSDRSFRKKDKKPKTTFAEQGLTRLNKFIANAGICSRREADALIASGAVSVNGKVITELGYKVKPTDDVNFSGEKLKAESQVYLLLNKPKDYITTAEDERGRRTVMELIEGACRERVYPVGRLDRNTTGLLLFTNDGQLTKKLTHPMHNVQKLYHAELDKNLKQPDLLKLREGLELEDGFIKPDEVAYAGESKREVGIQIHSGKNRVVRRMFEHLGYEVIKLDRVMFAGLTKKNLPKGRWRMLTEKEVAFLKMI
jgi:23S rRNA pseudouridine2605 synthase